MLFSPGRRSNLPLIYKKHIKCDSRITYPHNFYVSGIQQKGLLEVDEKGTRVAIVEQTEYVTTAEGIPFFVDHPFIFAIRDDYTEAILFLGLVSEPESFDKQSNDSGR
jgi:serine protease inhibitor